MNRIAPNAFACICTVTVHKFWIPPFGDPPFGPVAIVHHREIKGETWRALIGIENDRVAPTPCLATWRESCGTRFLPSSSRSWCAGQAGRVHVHHESRIIDINRTIKIELQKLWVLIAFANICCDYLWGHEFVVCFSYVPRLTTDARFLAIEYWWMILTGVTRRFTNLAA